MFVESESQGRRNGRPGDAVAEGNVQLKLRASWLLYRKFSLFLPFAELHGRRALQERPRRQARL